MVVETVGKLADGTYHPQNDMLVRLKMGPVGKIMIDQRFFRVVLFELLKQTCIKLIYTCFIHGALQSVKEGEDGRCFRSRASIFVPTLCCESIV